MSLIKKIFYSKGQLLLEKIQEIYISTTESNFYLCFDEVYRNTVFQDIQTSLYKCKESSILFQKKNILSLVDLIAKYQTLRWLLTEGHLPAFQSEERTNISTQSISDEQGSELRSQKVEHFCKENVSFFQTAFKRSLGIELIKLINVCDLDKVSLTKKMIFPEGDVEGVFQNLLTSALLLVDIHEIVDQTKPESDTDLTDTSLSQKQMDVEAVDTIQQTHNFCSQCGQKVQQEDKFCVSCGKELKPSVAANKSIDIEATAISKNNIDTESSVTAKNSIDKVARLEPDDLTHWVIVTVVIVAGILFSAGSFNSGTESILSTAEKQTVCKHYIGKLFGKKTSSISSSLEKQSGNTHFFKVSYGSHDYVCHIDKKNVVWAGLFTSNSEYDRSFRASNNGEPLGRWRYEDDARYTVKSKDGSKKVVLKIPNYNSFVINF